MSIYTLVRHQRVKKPPAEVFAFFNDPRNLERITPPRLRFKALAPPIALAQGVTVDYCMRLYGFPIHWTSLISVYEPPSRLVETQQRGPFSSWHHEYTLTEDAKGTRITEVVKYAIPFGVLGMLANRWFVRRQLEYIFDYRYSVMGRAEFLA